MAKIFIPESYQQYTNHHNIYLMDNVHNFNMARPFDRFWIHDWENYFDQAPEFKQNLYWSTSDNGIMDDPVFPGKKTWHEWKNGNDSGSLWVDPMFVNAQAGDYTLQGESPALTSLGIQQIIMGNFGVQENLKYAPCTTL